MEEGRARYKDGRRRSKRTRLQYPDLRALSSTDNEVVDQAARKWLDERKGRLADLREQLLDILFEDIPTSDLVFHWNTVVRHVLDVRIGLLAWSSESAWIEDMKLRRFAAYRRMKIMQSSKARTLVPKAVRLFPGPNELRHHVLFPGAWVSGRTHARFPVPVGRNETTDDRSPAPFVVSGIRWDTSGTMHYILEPAVTWGRVSDTHFFPFPPRTFWAVSDLRALPDYPERRERWAISVLSQLRPALKALLGHVRYRPGAPAARLAVDEANDFRRRMKEKITD